MHDCERFADFYEYVDKWELRNFKASELLIAVTRKNNHIPPTEIWDNIIPTILILDELRDHFDRPIVLSSVYRAEKYNGGIKEAAKKSQHQAFTAIDFHVRGKSPAEVGSILKEWRTSGKEFLLLHPIERKPVTVSAGTITQGPLVFSEKDGKQYFRFSGGIGIYRTFIHIDTRGKNRSWTGK